MAKFSWLASLRQQFQTQARTQRNRKKYEPKPAELLEPKQLLSVNSLVVSGDLTVVADANESLAIRLNPSNAAQVQLLVDGQVSNTFPSISPSQVRSISIFAGQGDNLIDLSAVTSAAFTFQNPVTLDRLQILVDAGNGADRLIGSLDIANDLRGGDGNDTLTGGSSSDTLNGGNGQDQITGGQGNDSLVGGDGNDSIFGEDGNDTLISGNGNDSTDGGAGNDTLEGNNGSDTLTGGDGDDTLNGDGGTDSLLGNAGNDVVLGGDLGDAIFGGDGNDTLDGQAGSDTILGDAGDDSLQGGSGADLLSGNLDDDTINGESGNDIVIGNDGDDVLLGGGGDDRIDGSAGNDLGNGNGGNDTLSGGGGRDTMNGATGFDVIQSVESTVGITSTVSVSEAVGNIAAITISLAFASTNTITVAYSTRSGTASSNVDFTATSGTLTFLPGAGSQTIQVPILPDTQVEGDEQFEVVLANVTGGALDAFNHTTVVTIMDDDMAATQQSQMSTRQHTTRAIPNDPLFANQWHLRNTGQTGGTVGADVEVEPVWDNYRGTGVVIGIVDDGLEHTHPDLSPNYVPALSFDFNSNDPDPTPTSTFDDHGTAVAGVAAGAGFNGLGISGAAPSASLSGLRLIAAPTTDLDEANALGFMPQGIDIYSNSWGPFDSGQGLDAPGPLTIAAIQNGVTNGRGGLGNIYTWAAGNGLLNDDNVNYDGYANSRNVIAVSAIDDRGVQSFYSEPGAPILVAAYSSGNGVGITTTDLVGNQGSDPSDYRNDFGGTSSATPLVSGVIALMLEANPNLTYRDVKHILVNTAEQNDATDSDWLTNGAGHLVNHKYGFGAINANAAVTAALNWTTVPAETSAVSQTVNVATQIPDNNLTGVTSTINVTQDISVEMVEVRFNATHSFRGDLEVVLTSPDGTRSVLTEQHNDPNNNYSNWLLTSARHWDESSAGTWTLTVRDLSAGTVGTFGSWQLSVFGTPNSVTPPGPGPGPGPTPGPMGPVDTEGDLLIGGDQDDIFQGGAGNDTIVGQGGADIVLADAGDDLVYGGAGRDTLNGGTGNDTLYGQGGIDVLSGDDGEDVLVWSGLTDSSDTFNSSTGQDTVEIRGTAGADTFRLGQTGSSMLVSSGAAVLTITGAIDEVGNPTERLAFNLLAGDDVMFIDDIDLVGVSSVVVNGGAGNDSIGAAGSNIGGILLVLNGEAGDDLIAGSNGQDVITGGLGNDVIRGGLGNDSVSGDEGDDTVRGEAGDDVLSGGLDNDSLLGGDGNDQLTGDDGNDVLQGELGDDSAIGGFGDDQISGAAGNDSLDGGIGQDSIAGGAGNDSIDGGRNNDSINGNAGDDQIQGNHGDDIIRGAEGNDTINGGDGNDTIDAGDGADGVLAGDGDDLVIGGEGRDTILGGNGNDTLNGGGSVDTILGGDGDDLINGNGGNDLLAGNEGVDNITDLAFVNGENFVLSADILAGLLL